MHDRILLVGDDSETAMCIDRALDESGYRIARAATIEHALELQAANALSAIVLEPSSPSGDGLEWIRQLREHHVGPPIILLTRPCSTDLAVKAVRAGAFDLVQKDDSYLTLLVGKVREAIAASTMRASLRRVVRPVFVGREAELAVLDDEISKAVAGDGRLVLVVGEEGIGKSSLLLEITRLARARAIGVLSAQCHQHEGAPAYWPWTQILRRYLKSSDSATVRDDLGDNAAALARIVPALREHCSEIDAAEKVELTRFHIVDGMSQFLKRVVTRRPLLIVLDDLHCADGDSLHLFGSLARDVADSPLLLLAALRDGHVSGPRATELARLSGEPRTTVLRLQGFEVAEVGRYVEHATTVQPSAALASAIHAKTEGHPLFVAEVARLLPTAQTPKETNGEIRLAIPATRRQAIADRLSRLSPACRRVLTAAAVIGQHFSHHLLRHVTDGECDHQPGPLQEALREQLVIAADDDPGLYKFTHLIVREVLYENLAPMERARLHAVVADNLELCIAARNATSTTTTVNLAAIAHHARRAALDANTFRRALHWVMTAGKAAAAMGAHEEAARHHAEAMDICEEAEFVTPALLHGILVDLAEDRWSANDLRGARDAGRRALTVAKQAADPTMIAEAALAFAGRLAGFCAIASDPEVTSELEQALALLPAATTALRALVMARLSAELVSSSRCAADWTLGQQAIELARSLNDPSVLAAVLRTTQWSVWTPDAVARRRQLGAEIVALADQTRDRALALDGELLQFWSALEHGDTNLGAGRLRLCEHLASQLRLPQYAMAIEPARIGLLVATGALDEAEHCAEQAYEKSQRSDDPTVALFMGAQHAFMQSLRGNLDQVGDWLRRMGTRFPPVTLGLESSLILTYARAGQSELARAQLWGFAADDFARVPRTPSWLMNMAVLANACVVVGDVEIARQLYGHLAPFTPYVVVLPPVLVLAPVAHYVGRLAVLIGNDAAARCHFEDAMAIETRMGARHCLALTQIAYGHLLQRSEIAADTERATVLVASGRALARELRLAPAVTDTETLGATPPTVGTRRSLFRFVDNAWELEFEGQRATVAHRVGMTYLRCLLDRPGVPVPAIELASAGTGAMLVELGSRPKVDRRAIAEVQHRLAAIDAEIGTCRQRAIAVSADLLHERAACLAYVTGRGSELLSAADRARSGVTKAIGRALKAIHDVHERLGHHLDRHVETGRLCVYIPDPAAPITFLA